MSAYLEIVDDGAAKAVAKARAEALREAADELASATPPAEVAPGFEVARLRLLAKANDEIEATR
jgi:hypothetical protein